MADAKSTVLTPSSFVSSETNGPMLASGVISSSPARARSTMGEASSGSTSSGVQVVGDLAEHRGDLRPVGLVGVAAATQRRTDAVEQLHEVFDHDRHVVSG